MVKKKANFLSLNQMMKEMDVLTEKESNNALFNV